MASAVALLRAPVTAQLAAAAALLAGVLWLAPGPLGMAGPLAAIAPAAPYAAVLLGAAAAAMFQSGNAAALAIGHGLAWALLRFEPPVPMPILPPSELRAGALVIAVALAALLLVSVKERGLLNRFGALRVAVTPALIAALLTGIYVWPAAGRVMAPSWLAEAVRPGAPALAAAALICTLTGWQAWRQASPMSAAMLVATLTAIGGLAAPHAGGWLVVAAGITLLVGALQTGYRLAFYDQLTGLPNRRALDLALRRLGSDYVLAMLDVDKFKSFNDTHGHEAGDDVLRLVAKGVRGVGGGGRPFRYGGEEFCIVFPGRELDQVHPVLEELRQRVAATPYTLRQANRPRSPRRGRQQRGQSDAHKSQPNRQITVTISIGAAEPEGLGDKPDAVLQRADKALYAAKQAGRNRLKS